MLHCGIALVQQDSVVPNDPDTNYNLSGHASSFDVCEVIVRYWLVEMFSGRLCRVISDIAYGT
jgi:hypothetical protein